MGSLGKMIDFLEETEGEVKDIREKLEEIQEYFNGNFNNITKIRTREITWLQEAFFEEESEFPKELVQSYEKNLPSARESFEKQFKNLTQRMQKLRGSMTTNDVKRAEIIAAIRGNNKKLDNREEKLKASVGNYEADLAEYNNRIDELNSGFGFIINFFKMKAIQKEKDRLIDRRDDLIDQIEEIRGKWQEQMLKMEEKDTAMQDQWLEEKAELSMTEEKLSILEHNRELLIQRAAFMDSLQDLTGREKFGIQGAPSKPGGCRRCKSDNTSNYYFCRYCGEPFGEDRQDITGSLGELGELNIAFEDVQKGIQESVSFIALMKGLLKGIDVFTGSVKDVKKSQDQYSTLSKLKIDVPGGSAEFSDKIKKINDSLGVKFKNLHPAEFAESFKKYSEEVLTDKKIEAFFTAMGDELDRTTKEQW